MNSVPNWVYNRVHGSKAVCSSLLDEKGRPTFTKLVPTPHALKLMEEVEDSQLYSAYTKSILDADPSSLLELYTRRNPGKPYDEWVDELATTYPLDVVLARKDLQDEYGVDGWYDFNCKYYGCKWDASSEEEYEDGVTEIEFQTPWSPPEPIMDLVANMFPEEKFTWHCDEESCAFSFDRDYHGDGTYSEHDVFPEYFTPYIPEESVLLEQLGNDYEDSSALIDAISTILPDQCNYDIQEDKDANTLSLTVYDWDVYGGDELYTHVFEGVQYK